MRLLLTLALALAFAAFGPVAFAQSSAQPTVPGYLTTSGCPAGVTTCFVQYGAAGGTGGTVLIQPAPSTPTAGAASAIVTGGTAVTLIAASSTLHGCSVYNPPTATGQAIAAAENAYVNPVGTATTTGNGTTYELVPGQPWNCPPGMTTALSGNAATSGHALSVVVW